MSGWKMVKMKVELGSVEIETSARHELDAMEWWNAFDDESLPSAAAAAGEDARRKMRRSVFLAGVYVVRNGLQEGLGRDAWAGHELEQLGRRLEESGREVSRLQAAAEAAEARWRVREAEDRVEAAERQSRLEEECSRRTRGAEDECEELRRRLAEAARGAEQEAELRRRGRDEEVEACTAHLKEEVRRLREDARTAHGRGREDAEAEVSRMRAEVAAARLELARSVEAASELDRMRTAAAVSEAREAVRREMAARVEESAAGAARMEVLYETTRARLEASEGGEARERLRRAGEEAREATERARRAEEALEAFKGTNRGKGAVGESTVAGLLRSRFARNEVEEKGSVESHSQDVWMHVDGGKHIAFESKNKRVVTKGDVDKFYRDVSVMPSCSGAMMVSLATPNVPGKGSFAMEVYNGRPVMFVGFEGLEECGRFLGVYAQVLVTLASHSEAMRAEGEAQREGGGGGAARLGELVGRLAPAVERIRRTKNEMVQLGNGLRAMCRTVDGMQSDVEGVFGDMERLITTYGATATTPSEVLPEADAVVVEAEQQQSAEKKKAASRSASSRRKK